MARKTAAKRKKAPSPIAQREDVTPERAARNAFESAGMARKLVPSILVLLRAGSISQAEYEALDYYRDQASRAEQSPARCVLDRTPSGGGHGPGAAIISAQIETGRIERDLGQLADIARAVAVDDKSLAQWCIDRYGGRERYDRHGAFVAMVPVCERRNMALALLELRMAARRIVR